MVLIFALGQSAPLHNQASAICRPRLCAAPEDKMGTLWRGDARNSLEQRTDPQAARVPGTHRRAPDGTPCRIYQQRPFCRDYGPGHTGLAAPQGSAEPTASAA